MAKPNSIEISTSQSEWGALSNHLIATLYPVGYDGKPQYEETNGQKSIAELRAPLVDDANMEMTFNWQSNFENTDIDNSAQSVAGMAQIGGFEPLAKLFGGIGEDLVKRMQGKTGITKLNSTQVFTGSPPVKFSITLLFRAWDNPKREVEECLDLLMKWAMPRKLADSGGWALRGLQEAITAAKGGDASALDWILPSQVPQLVGMLYKNRTYKPLVIENVGVPLSSPVDANGDFVDLKIPITLASLTALDRNDWAQLKR